MNFSRAKGVITFDGDRAAIDDPHVPYTFEAGPFVLQMDYDKLLVYSRKPCATCLPPGVYGADAGLDAGSDAASDAGFDATFDAAADAGESDGDGGWSADAPYVPPGPPGPFRHLVMRLRWPGELSAEPGTHDAARLVTAETCSEGAISEVDRASCVSTNGRAPSSHPAVTGSLTIVESTEKDVIQHIILDLKIQDRGALELDYVYQRAPIERITPVEVECFGSWG
jgi:hypothetical protein